MRYADTSAGTYENDDSLEAIENHEDGFGIPGTSAVGTVGSYRFADIGNEDENSTRLTALGDEPKDTIDVTGKPPAVKNEGLSSVSPGSLSTIIGANMSMNARIAYVMENGEPFCNHCETNYFPGTRIACTNCGCGQPQNDHGLGQNNFKGEDLSTVEGPSVAKLDGGKDIIKEESKLGFVEMAMDAFKKESSSSELYFQGRIDAQAGKPLDEDMALLSKEYYNGYNDYKFYNKTPQQSEGQSLFDIKPNSNQIPRSHGNMTPGEYDRGPLELTDGIGRATAGIKDFFNRNKKTPERPAVPQATHGVDNHALLQTLNQMDPELAKHYSNMLGITLEDSSSTTKPITEENFDQVKKDAGYPNTYTGSRKFSSVYPIDVIQKFFEI